MIFKNDPDEIPILGSSRCSGSYIPEIINSHAWNYGIEGTEYDVVEFMLNHELAKNKKTPVIINLDYEFLDSTRLGDLANYLPNSDQKDINNLIKDSLLWYHHFPGIKYFGRVEHYLKFYIGDHSSKNLSSKGGFFLLWPFSEIEFNYAVKKRLESKHAWTNDSTRTRKFAQLMAAHPERTFYLVTAPVHKSYNTSMINLNDVNFWMKQMSLIPNLRLIDFSTADYPDSLFLNSSHLNYEGAKRFSEELKIILSNDNAIFRQ